MLTAIIDYESGNLHSAQKAFERMANEVGAGEVIVTSDAEVVARADRIVLPGDGAFPSCYRALKGTGGLFDAMREAVEEKGRPFLGICVGMQLMATLGREYSETPGLNWIKGEVVAIKPENKILKVPHMGWNDLIINQQHPVLRGVETGDHTYFVHSYHFEAANSTEILAHVDYGHNVTAVIGRDTMVGMQFHPEKSQGTGLRMLSNFLQWKP